MGLPTSSATCHMCSFARLVLEDVLLLFSCVDLCYRVHILTRHNFCFSFDAGCLAFQCKTEKPTRRSASAAVSKETQCKCCRFLFFVLGSLLPLSSCWALSIHKVTEAEIAQKHSSKRFFETSELQEILKPLRFFEMRFQTKHFLHTFWIFMHFWKARLLILILKKKQRGAMQRLNSCSSSNLFPSLHGRPLA